MAADLSTMRGLWVENGNAVVRDDIRRPTPKPGWALIEVGLSGVCGTDLQILDGYAEFTGILGHEFVGRVIEGSEPWLGQRVVGEINIGCGECDQCQRNSRHCPRRGALGIRELNGSFAEYLVLPERNLHRVPASVSDADAVFVEPLAAAFHVADHVPQAAAVLVVGDGRLGQLTARALHSAGRAVSVVGRHPSKLARLESLGIEAGGAARGTFDVAVECSGNPSGFATACAALRPEGTLVLKSTFPPPSEIDASILVVNEITTVGSRCGPFEPALEALSRGAIEVADLVDARFALADANQALAQARRPGIIKVLVDSKSLPMP